MQIKQQTEPSKKAKRLLKMQHLCEKMKLSKTFIYSEIEKKRFPKPLKIGRSSFWVESEVDDYIDSLIVGRDAA